MSPRGLKGPKRLQLNIRAGGSPSGKSSPGKTGEALKLLAEFEREMMVERVRAGLANARAKGKSLGRSKERRAEKRIITIRKQGQRYGTATVATACQSEFLFPLSCADR